MKTFSSTMTRPHDERQAQAKDARAVALRRRQLVRQDGDENQVIDSQDDLKDDQGKQADPRSGVQQPLHQELQKLHDR